MVRRTVRVLRAGAALLAHPDRLAQWRTHLSRAWHAPTARSGSPARPHRSHGPPPRPVRVLVHAEPELADRLRPEWQQLSPDGHRASPAGAAHEGVALLVLGWPAPADPLDAVVDDAVAAGTPVVVWDTAPAGAATSPHAGRASVVLVSSSARLADYPGPTRVLDPGVQLREHNPMRTAGASVPVATLGLAPADALAELGPTLGGPVRPDRRHEVVVAGSAAPAARVLELVAEGAVVVTDDAGLVELDPVQLVADGDAARVRLGALTRHAELRARAGLLGIRAAGARSTTAAVDTLLSDLGIGAPRRARPVSAIVPTMRPDQIEHVLEVIAAQRHPQVQLVLITHGFEAPAGTPARADELGVDLRLIPASADLTLGALMNLGVSAADGEYVAKMDDDNAYGAHYLSDLLATFDYSGAQVAGKWAHLTHLRSTGATFLRFPEAENTLTRLVQGGTLVLPRDVATELRFEDLPRRVDTTFLEKVAAAGGSVYSADRYNFVSVRGTDVAGHTWKITDDELLAKPSSDLFFGEPWAHAEL